MGIITCYQFQVDASTPGALTLESGTGMCRGHDPFFRPVGAP